MRSCIVSIERVADLGSLHGKGHDYFVNRRRVARIGGMGADQFTYYLFDKLHNDAVVRHILRLAKCRARDFNEFVAFTCTDSENRLQST